MPIDDMKKIDELEERLHNVEMLCIRMAMKTMSREEILSFGDGVFDILKREWKNEKTKS